MTMQYVKVDSQRMDAIRSRFASIGCAQMADAAPYLIRPLRLPFQPRNDLPRVCGPAFPIATRNDMLPCLQALAAAPSGWVLMIHNEISPSEALVGDILVASAQTQGLAGIVVDGAIRDLVDLKELNIPVFSTDVTFVSARTTDMAAPDVPMTIQVGGIDISPGQWIFGDEDGFLAIEEQHVDAVLLSGLVLREREEFLKARINAGETLSELTGLEEFVAGHAPLKFSP